MTMVSPKHRPIFILTGFASCPASIALISAAEKRIGKLIINNTGNLIMTNKVLIKACFKK